MLHTPLSGLRFLSKYTSQACLLTDIWSKKKKNHVKTAGSYHFKHFTWTSSGISVAIYLFKWKYEARRTRTHLREAPPLCGFNTKADGFQQQGSSLGRLQEEVLDTPGLPDLQGGATVSTFIHNSDSNINAKWLKVNPAPRKGERWGSGGQRVGEGGGRRKGEGPDTRRADPH